MVASIAVLANLKARGSIILDVDTGEFPETPERGQLVIKDQGLYAYITVSGSTTWYPLVRAPSSYTHQQTVASAEWTIEHNLSSNDLWYQVQDENGEEIHSSGFESLGMESFKVTFAEPVVGKVLVLATTIGQGQQGIKGDPGTSVLHGVGAPTSAIGLDGDSYIDTATYTLYGPKTLNDWPAGVSLVGPKGDKGDKGDQGLPGVDGQDGGSAAFLDRDAVAPGPIAFDFENQCQRAVLSAGAYTFSFTGWPAGALGEMLLRLENAGLATITWPAIKWVLSDGKETTNFANNGATLQTNGTDWIMLWTHDGGANIYGKVMR